MYEQNECPVPKGVLFAIGGKEDKGEPSNKKGPDDQRPLEILKTFLGLTNKETPVIEIITSGAGDAAGTFADYKKVFHELGLNDLRHMHHSTREEVHTPELLSRAREADAFFFTGGDQLLLTSLYGGSEFLTVLKDRYIREPVVIAGTSAGAMAMSTPMIYAGNEDVQEIAGEIKVTTGLEFLKDVCIDTHFVHRSRFIRMAQVIATNPTSIGIGIEEDTAVVVRNGKDAEVVGSGTVIIIEGFRLSEANMKDFAEGKLISIRDLNVHLLSKENTYQIPLVNPPHH